ncbi:MAG: hypothetical protein QXX17_02195 [Conexivisphaerales archaeon]
MYNEIIITSLCAGLLLTSFFGLASKKVSTTLIMLFYSSIFLGIILTVLGDALLGLLHMVTYAGALSVMLLSVILITGQSDLSLHSRSSAKVAGAVAIAIAAVASFLMFDSSGALQVFPQDVSLQLFSFLWQFRPWDLLILVMLFMSSMLVLVNLFSKGD